MDAVGLKKLVWNTLLAQRTGRWHHPRSWNLCAEVGKPRSSFGDFQGSHFWRGRYFLGEFFSFFFGHFFFWSSGPLDRTPGPPVLWSSGPLVPRSSCPLVPWSSGLVVVVSSQIFILKDLNLRFRILILKDLRSSFQISTQGFEIKISMFHI